MRKNCLKRSDRLKSHRLTNVNSIRKLCVTNSLLGLEKFLLVDRFTLTSTADNSSSARRNTVNGRISSVANQYTFEKVTEIRFAYYQT